MQTVNSKLHTNMPTSWKWHPYYVALVCEGISTNMTLIDEKRREEELDSRITKLLKSRKLKCNYVHFSKALSVYHKIYCLCDYLYSVNYFFIETKVCKFSHILFHKTILLHSFIWIIIRWDHTFFIFIISAIWIQQFLKNDL